MKILSIAVVFVLTVSMCTVGQQQSSDAKPSEPPVFRDPFTLRLHVDKDHYYEEHYDRKIPYVADNDIYLFSGEHFGVTLNGKEVATVSYQPDMKKADVWFTFREEKLKDGRPMMVLTIQNKLKQELYMDALMTRPDAKGIFKTSIVPIPAGLTDYESWPHPIVQLVLRNLRFIDKQTSGAN
jgi:hypothetical protein